MQFVCDRCKTKYEIELERIRGKSLKIRCRSCSTIIDIRDPALAAGRPAVASPPKPPGKAPGKGKAAAEPAGGTLADRFQQAFEGPGARAPAEKPAEKPAEDATHIVMAPSLAGNGVAQDVARKLARWHVAIRNQPMGPMNDEAIRRHIDDGALGPASLAWREGFDEWRPLRTVEELSYLLDAAGRADAPAAGAARESIFELPPMRPGVGTPTIAPSPPASHVYLFHGIVGVIAFALGMLFMYVIGGRRGDVAPECPEPMRVAAVRSGAEEVGVTSNGLPVIRSGSLTITLENPTIVAEEPASAPARKAGERGGRSNERPGGRPGVGTGQGAGAAEPATPAPYVPSRDPGPAAGAIRTAGPGTIAIGGQESRGLTGNQILPVVQEGQNGIQLCYNQARTRDFVQDLSMRMAIEINPDGSVRNVTLTTEDYVSGELHDCLTSRVRRWRFPRATAASRVVLPFAFHQR